MVALFGEGWEELCCVWELRIRLYTLWYACVVVSSEALVDQFGAGCAVGRGEEMDQPLEQSGGFDACVW